MTFEVPSHLVPFVARGLTHVVGRLQAEGDNVPPDLYELLVEATMHLAPQVPSVDVTGSDFASWVTVEDAAWDIDRSGSFVRRLCRTKQLRAVQPTGWAWRIDPDSLDEYKRTTRRRTA